MWAVSAAAVVVGRLVFVARCTRLAPEPRNLGAPMQLGSDGVAAAAPEDDQDQPRKTARSWRSPKAWPLLLGASRLAGESMFGSGGDRELWRSQWGSKSAARAPSSRRDARGPFALAAARRGFVPTRPEDRTDGRQGWAVPAAVALRGGFENLEVKLEDPAREPSAHQSPFEVDPAAEPYQGQAGVEEAGERLLKGAWKAIIRPQLTMWIEFVFEDGGLYAEIRYSDASDSSIEVVKLSAAVVDGDLFGFFGINGLFHYHLIQVGEDLQITLHYPSSFWEGADNLTFFGHPAPRLATSPRGHAASSWALNFPTAAPTAPTLPMHEKVIRRIERFRDSDEVVNTDIDDDIIVQLNEITVFMRKPGYWLAQSLLTGTTGTYDVEFRFFETDGEFECMVSLDYKDAPIADVVKLVPYHTGDFATDAFRNPGYEFTVEANRLKVEIVFVEEGGIRRIQALLDYKPFGDVWPISALYANRLEPESID